MELMKQKQYSPMNVAQMALSLFAINQGFLDDVEPAKVQSFDGALQSYMKAKHAATLDEINQKGDYTDAIAASLQAAVTDFKATSTW
jgi:F-type H+-transporting ATPase subunit alpha